MRDAKKYGRFLASHARARFTLEDHAYGAFRLPKTTVLQSTVRLTVDTSMSQKRSFISRVRPTIHTNPSRKRSFISTVRLTVDTNPSRKRSFIFTVRPTVHTNPTRKLFA